MNATQDAPTQDAGPKHDRQILPERVTIRPYRSADHPALLALWEEADLAPFTEIETERLLHSGGGALVAEAMMENGGATIVGTVLWSHNGHIGLIWKLAVRRAYRLQGIARRLLQQAEYDVMTAGFAGIALLTRNTNTPARSLYQREGWTHRTHNEFWVKRLKKAAEPLTGEEQTKC